VEYLNSFGSKITNDENIYMGLKPGFPWQKEHSTRPRIPSPANWT
jgi:hypothetical protein